jgi:AcrR family transcriptional regulator
VAEPGVVTAPRRERKKQQTRDALVAAALDRFEAKGYEHTAIREITDAVDVSERTFFRYFASKEDLALSFIRDAADLVTAALAARPAGEEPLAALLAAVHESVATLIARRPVLRAEPTYLRILKLIDATPVLLAAQLQYSHEQNEKVVRVLAAREGLDPAIDRRPRLLAATFGGLVFLATRDWRTSGPHDADAMLTALDGYAAQLGPALAGHWARPAGQGTAQATPGLGS